MGFYSDYLTILQDLLVPGDIAERIEDLDLDELWRSGYRALLLDVDNTLLTYRQRRLDYQKENWIETAKSVGFSVFLVSNNIRYSRIDTIARQVQVRGTYFSLKPFIQSAKLVLSQANIKPEDAVVIGDQVLTDVVMGNWLRCHTILVDPLDKKLSFIKTVQREVELFILRQIDGARL